MRAPSLDIEFPIGLDRFEVVARYPPAFRLAPCGLRVGLHGQCLQADEGGVGMDDHAGGDRRQIGAHPALVFEPRAEFRSFQVCRIRGAMPPAMNTPPRAPYVSAMLPVTAPSNAQNMS